MKRFIRYRVEYKCRFPSSPNIQIAKQLFKLAQGNHTEYGFSRALKCECEITKRDEN